MNFKLFFRISIVCFFCLQLKAQELPPITTYSTEVYSGGNQNWSVSQSEEKFIYVANNDGLLEFNGESWNHYPSPNSTIVRSVLANEGKIYTGSYMDFGYWERDTTGRLQYFSLGETVYPQMIEDEQFWSIKAVGDWVLFQSLNRIYIYNTSKGDITHISTTGIVSMYEIEDNIYFQDVTEGVFKITNGVSKKVDKLDSLKDNRIINIFGHKDELLILTETNGFFKVTDEGILKWDIAADKKLSGESVYSGIELNDGSYAIGTISKGLLLIDSQGNVMYNLNQTNGLNNNTVLSLFEDQDQNVWVGLDNGINLINLKSPLTIFNDDKGDIGAVYASQEYDGKLYLGTNQGLFYKDYNSGDGFKFVPKTNGQVWSLFIHDNTLFCGHNIGTLVIDEDKATLVSSIPGTWNIQVIPGSSDLLQGNYAGLSVLEKKDGQWRLKNKITGFDYSARFLEIDGQDNLWINHEYKGVFKLNIDKDFKNITKVSIDSTAKKGKSSGLIKYDGKLIYASENGVFNYNMEQGGFVKDSLLSSVFSQDNSYTTGKMVVDSAMNLWLFSEKSINYITKGQFSKELIVNTLSIPNRLRNSIIGYENISLLMNGKYLLGTSSGYLIMDNSTSVSNNRSIYLNSFTVRKDEVEARLALDNEQTDLGARQNTISFEYSVPDFSMFLTTEYQVFLEGYNSKWSNWVESNSITFENLPAGDYTFKARSRTGNVKTVNEISVKLEIARPWYQTNTAIAVYILLGIIFFTALNSVYRGYYRRQRESLLEKTNKDMKLKEMEAQKEIIQLRNKHLNDDIEARNRELAISTMNMIKKNETLNSIKSELGKLEDDNGISSVMRVIDKNLNNKEDWEFFEAAFNHADKDFFKKVKEIHPQLTANDLRLCVYLRMNLSSKEIAPLLNISHRSVEIKRYRLRKKIDLSREINLNDYFINL